ncbi:AzlD domain-containing protein [Pseudomonas sp. NPDC089743]|uniref:AzlD domain-containing protein n=1 Tax=Pseudomonas sp. NPDC089743 TaxID=3364471 RepID=UPI0037FA17ED
MPRCRDGQAERHRLTDCHHPLEASARLGVLPDAQAGVDWSNPQIPAAVVAGLVAWRTRSTLLTLGVGMATLWVLKYLGL